MISFDKGLVVACKCFEYNLITVFFKKLRVKHLQISSSSEAGRTVFTFLVNFRPKLGVGNNA